MIFNTYSDFECLFEGVLVGYIQGLDLFLAGRFW